MIIAFILYEMIFLADLVKKSNVFAMLQNALHKHSYNALIY